MSSPITTELVKELRDATGISVMQCRRALVEAEGDMNKALAILKKTSSDIALKKADRETKDGAVMIKEADGKSILVIFTPVRLISYLEMRTLLPYWLN